MPECGDGIFPSIFWIVEQFYIIFIDKVVKFLLEIAYHNGDILDTDLVKLFDLSLNHPFSKYFQETLGSFVGQRHKT